LETSGLHYPNRFAWALFQAIKESAGSASLNSILNATGLSQRYSEVMPPDEWAPGLDFAEIAAVNYALEDIYGVRGGRGMALRAGMAFFDYGLKDVGVLKGVTTAQFYALPIAARAQISLMGLVTLFSAHSSQASFFEDPPGDAFHFIASPSPFAWERVSDSPVCHVLVGTLRASLRWATDGYEFAVNETLCRATGADACVFSVKKNPIGRV
jgi:hypothetical protein